MIECIILLIDDNNNNIGILYKIVLTDGVPRMVNMCFHVSSILIAVKMLKEFH